MDYIFAQQVHAFAEIRHRLHMHGLGETKAYIVKRINSVLDSHSPRPDT